jgi:hypothetical protein
VHRWDSSKENGVDACAVDEFCRLQEWYGMGWDGMGRGVMAGCGRTYPPLSSVS